MEQVTKTLRDYRGRPSPARSAMAAGLIFVAFTVLYALHEPGTHDPCLWCSRLFAPPL